MTRSIEVYTEAGTKRVFAGAHDWPGWCRAAKDEAGALAALVAYGPRYASILAGGPGEAGGDELTPPAQPGALRVVERLPGGSGTDFGVPSRPPAADQADLDPSETERLARILKASWSALDRAAAGAQGVTLRTGPRGGGRDLAKILGHVLEAEQAYVGQLGSRPPKSDGAPTYVETEREAALQAFIAGASGRPMPDPRQTKRPWTPRYFVRRAVWHVLDHAWEIEDRARPDP